MIGRTQITFASADDRAARFAWQHLLESVPAARVHADLRWLDVLRQAYGVRDTVVLARDASGAVLGGLAGYESRTLRWQRTFHSLRHGLLATQDAALPALLAAVSGRSRERGCVSAIVGGSARLVDASYRESIRHALLLDLNVSAQSLWSGFRDKVRNTIRRAERAGLTVSRDAGHLDAFHALYARAMTERGVNVRSRKFFHSLFSVFGTDARLYSALSGGRLCGAMVVIAAGGQSVYPYGAFDDDGHRLGANSLLLWHVARDLAADGVWSLDLGPSAPGSGSFRFKTHVGGVPQELHYVELLQARAVPGEGGMPQPRAAPSSGRLDRVIGYLPMAIRIQAHTWLGYTGRLL